MKLRVKLGSLLIALACFLGCSARKSSPTNVAVLPDPAIPFESWWYNPAGVPLLAYPRPNGRFMFLENVSSRNIVSYTLGCVTHEGAISHDSAEAIVVSLKPGQGNLRLLVDQLAIRNAACGSNRLVPVKIEFEDGLSWAFDDKPRGALRRGKN